MSKSKKSQEVHHSTYEIHVDNEILTSNTHGEAETKYRNAIKRESSSFCYLYRNDFNEEGKLIEKYML